MMERIETTCADLRPTDLVIDKAGNAWPIEDLDVSVPHSEQFGVTFMLCDPATKVRMHFMRKGRADAVTVSRAPSQADEAAKLEDGSPAVPWTETPEIQALTSRKLAEIIDKPFDEALIRGDEAEELVKSALNAEVVVEYTAEEYYAAEEANEDAPLRPPPFADMTPLEQRSHLYLLHGVIAYDLKSAEELKSMHEQAHAQQEAGTLQSAYIPHTHDGSF